MVNSEGSKIGIQIVSLFHTVMMLDSLWMFEIKSLWSEVNPLLSLTLSLMLPKQRNVLPLSKYI